MSSESSNTNAFYDYTFMHVSAIIQCCALGFVLVLAGCNAKEPQWYSLEGETMGSTYHIQYLGNDNYQKQIDVLLKEINNAVSTYMPESTISRFNANGGLAIPLNVNGEPQEGLHRHFFANLEEAYEIFRQSDGYFDPTVGPLVEIWGFGKAGHQSTYPDSAQIDSLRGKVGMQFVDVKADRDTIHISVRYPGMQLDFGGIAQGYGTDRVFDLLVSKGVTDQFVEITGEVRVSGKSPRGDEWVVGINVPEEGADLKDIGARLRLNGMAMATSGNYRNFYMLGGRKVWHTINPKTGYPEENNLLCSTIVHPRCITADALATACMVMGADDAIGLIRKIPGAEAYFIYRDAAGNIATFTSPKLTKDLLPQ